MDVRICQFDVVNGKNLLPYTDNVVYYSVTEESWVPYWIVGPESISGVFYEVMNYIDGRLPVSLKPIQPVPLKRAKHLLAHGEVHIECCVNPLWRDDSRKTDFFWSDTLFDSKEVLVFAKGSRFEFNDINDLEGRDIATVLGYGYIGDNYFNRVDVIDSKAQLKMLERGRVDAAIFDFNELQYLPKRYPDLAKMIDELEVGPIINHSELKMRLHPSKASLLLDINKLIKQMKETGEMSRIFQLYQ